MEDRRETGARLIPQDETEWKSPLEAFPLKKIPHATGVGNFHAIHSLRRRIQVSSSPPFFILPGGT